MISSYFLYEYLLVSLVVCDSKLNIFRQNSIFEEFTLVAALDATNTTYIGYSLKGSETDYCYVFISMYTSQFFITWICCVCSQETTDKHIVLSPLFSRYDSACVSQCQTNHTFNTFCFLSKNLCSVQDSEDKQDRWVDRAGGVGGRTTCSEDYVSEPQHFMYCWETI